MSKRGFSLPEILLSCLLLSIFLVLIFAFLRSGLGTVLQTQRRGGVLAEARRAALALEKELAQTAAESVQTVQRLDASNVYRRDAICLAQLSDWNSSSSFSPDSGQPLWDRYVIFYASRVFDGVLVRADISSSSPVTGPYTAFASLNLPDDAQAVAPIHSARIVCDSVRELSFATKSGTVSVRLLFEHVGLDSQGSRKTENYELQTDINIHNNFR